MRSAEITILAQDHHSVGIIPHSPNIRVLRHPHIDALEQSKNIFVLWSAGQLQEVSDFVRLANQRHHLRALFVREDANIYWLPQILDQANIRILRNLLVHRGFDIPRRVLSAWQIGAQKQLIANATISNESLLVVSCALEHIEVPLDTLYGIKELNDHDRKIFEIAEDGSYIYWPGGDIHIDLETIRCAIDPKMQAKSQLSKLVHDQKIGSAVALLRKKYHLRQSDISGLSERQVRRIENGESASFEALTHLAIAVGKNIEDCLDELSIYANQINAES